MAPLNRRPPPAPMRNGNLESMGQFKSVEQHVQLLRLAIEINVHTRGFTLAVIGD